MKRPSGDHDGSNSGQGDRVRRLSPVPFALMDQMSWELSKTIRPESDVRSIAPPPRAGLEGVLYVHGSPFSDVDSFAPEPQEDEARMLAGVRDRTVVFGHSHQQFTRPGPDGTTLVNPGSVGMPLDGDRRAAWAVSPQPGEFEFRRCDYDVERAAAAYRAMGGDFGEFAARRIRKGSD